MKSGFLSSPNASKADNPNLGPLQDSRSNVKLLWGGYPIRSNNDNSGWGTSFDEFKKNAQSSLSKDLEISMEIAAEENAEEKSRSYVLESTSKMSNDQLDQNLRHQPATNANEKPKSTLPGTTPIHAPYAGIPNLPNKTMGVPKNALSAHYGKRHLGIPLSNIQFHSWSDNGASHLLKWSSTFTCPITQEKFQSGRYGDERFWVVKDGTVWYRKKMMAEHAAAARALDCFLWRESGCQDGSESWRLCVEEPYGDSMIVEEVENKKDALHPRDKNVEMRDAYRERRK